MRFRDLLPGRSCQNSDKLSAEQLGNITEHQVTNHVEDEPRECKVLISDSTLDKARERGLLQ